MAKKKIKRLRFLRELPRGGEGEGPGVGLSLRRRGSGWAGTAQAGAGAAGYEGRNKRSGSIARYRARRAEDCDAC